MDETDNLNGSQEIESLEGQKRKRGRPEGSTEKARLSMKLLNEILSPRFLGYIESLEKIMQDKSNKNSYNALVKLIDLGVMVSKEQTELVKLKPKGRKNTKEKEDLPPSNNPGIQEGNVKKFPSLNLRG